MRLPLHKPYRAFPELDRFSDAECARFAAAARRHHRVGSVLLGLLCIPCIAIAVPLLIGLPWGICHLLGLENTFADETATMIVWATSLTSVCGMFFLLGLLIRDRWLRHIIGKQLRGAACNGCRYSLLGLPIVNGVITCPECGRPFDLAEADLRPEDLLAQPAVASEGTRTRPAADNSVPTVTGSAPPTRRSTRPPPRQTRHT